MMTGETRLKILVPVDFSPLSLAALQAALVIADALRASVTVLRVIENVSSSSPEDMIETKAVLDDLISVAKETLRSHVVPSQGHLSPSIFCQVGSGDPADQICHTATLYHMALIVMGTRGKSEGLKASLGATACKVVSFAACSVMTIPGTGSPFTMQKILIPVRLTPHALDKFDLVRAIVKSKNAEVVIVGLMKENEPGGSFNMENLLTYIAGKIDEVNGTCRSEIHYSENAAHQLACIADKENPDLIVVPDVLEDCWGEAVVRTPDSVNYSRFPVLNLRRPLWEQPAHYQNGFESTSVSLIRTKIKYHEKRLRWHRRWSG